MSEKLTLNSQARDLSGSDLAAYWAVRDGRSGVIDLTSRGRIRVSGSEAVMFLNGLITNDMKTLGENHWMPAAFPNVQGRLIAAVRVIRLPDETIATKTSPRFLIDTEAATHEAVLKTIERFTMAGDFRVADITDGTAMFSVQGQNAVAVVHQVVGDSISELARDGVFETRWRENQITVIRASHTAEDGFDVVVDGVQSGAFSKVLHDAGAIYVLPETLETLRIEAGIGCFGVDMDDTNVVSEANLDDAVSFTKGCYIGQEIIARIKYRGHVAKKLTGLLLEGSEIVDGGSDIKSVESKVIGRITSTTFSPSLNKIIALGYVRFEHLAVGTEVIVGESDVKAKVTELPFVRGSWYEGVLS